MRRVLNRAAQRGMTMIELMVALAIMSMLALTAAPYFTDYGVNSRLRESGNTLYAETLFAQSEAIKRNGTVQVAISSGTVTLTDITNSDSPQAIRSRQLSDGVTASSATFAFGSQGSTAGLAAASVDLESSAGACSDNYRCPGLRVDAGGAVRLCRNHVAGCS